MLGSRVGFALLSTVLALAVAFPRAAHAQVPIRGVGPDLQIAGGIGVGLGGTLDNMFLGRLRLGALYAFEPYVVNIGLTGELGAVAELAIGGEIEWNEFRGWFANAGLAYAKHERLTSHLSVGYMIFGLEWQHAFEKPKPVDALLLTVRFPLGVWWFTSGHDERPFAPPPSSPRAAANQPVAGPRPLGPTQPSAAGATAGPPPESEPHRRAQTALAEAALAEARADHATVAAALRRAHAAEPDPLLWLRIADADLAQGKRALAAEDLQQFLAGASSPEALARKPSVETRLNDLLAQLARLRVSFEAASGGERVTVDGIEQPGAALGYDVLLEPGLHRLIVQRADRVLAEREFEAKAGQLVRLSLPLSAAGP